jgi:hypothetical protein
MNKNIFIITSALKPRIGVFSHEERYNQTINCLEDLRLKLPDEFLILADCSVFSLSEEEKLELSSKVDLFLDLSTCEKTLEYSKMGLKSHAENSLLYTVLTKIKDESFFKNSKRVFKISARSWLTEQFTLSDYEDTYGKYVFKKRILSWMNNSTYLFVTRLYSFCSSLVEEYLEIIQKNEGMLSYLDTEHIHFINVPQDKLIELDNIHCWGYLASNGTTEYY